MNEQFNDSIQKIRKQTQSTLNDLLQIVVHVKSKIANGEDITGEELQLLNKAIDTAQQKAKTIGLEFIDKG